MKPLRRLFLYPTLITKERAMPKKPGKPCKHMGCPNLSEEYYCGQHRREEAKIYNKYKRDPETKKSYGTAWRKIQAQYIQSNPLCEICREEGKIISAEVVHHRIELKAGGSHSNDNLQSLCRSHHSSVHMRRRNNNT